MPMLTRTEVEQILTALNETQSCIHDLLEGRVQETIRAADDLVSESGQLRTMLQQRLEHDGVTVAWSADEVEGLSALDLQDFRDQVIQSGNEVLESLHAQLIVEAEEFDEAEHERLVEEAELRATEALNTPSNKSKRAKRQRLDRGPGM